MLRLGLCGLLGLGFAQSMSLDEAHRSLLSLSPREFASSLSPSAVVRNMETGESFALTGILENETDSSLLRSCLETARMERVEQMAWLTGMDCEAVFLEEKSGWNVRELSMSSGALSRFLQERQGKKIQVTQDQSLTLNVMSFNIRFGTANDGVNRWIFRRQLAFDVVATRDPDFVGMQEGLDFQIDEFIAEMPQYATIGVGRDDGFYGGEFSNILYNKEKWSAVESGTFWMCQDLMGPPGCKSHDDQGVSRIGSWGRFLSKSDSMQYVYIYNFHLDHRSDASRTFSIATLLEEIQGRRQRTLSSGLIEDIPVVVTGDFNIGENSDGAELMRTSGFVDTFRELYPNEQDVGTFHGFTGVANGDKIDYVWAPNSTANGGFVTTHTAEIIRDAQPPLYPSDHWVVDATFTIRQ